METNGIKPEAVRADATSVIAAAEEIYREAFPASERKPASFLLEAVLREDYELLVLYFGGKVAAFAIVYHSPAQKLCLIEYMATARPLRGHGFGRTLLRMIIQRWPDRTLLFEVEAGVAGAVGDAAARRKRFYEWFGCRELAGVDYRMPQVSTEPPPPMHLLVWRQTGASVPRLEVESWLRDVFHNVYGLEDPDAFVYEIMKEQPEAIALH